MRAMIFKEYGNPKEVMSLTKDVKLPDIDEDEVLVKIERSSINAADKYMVRANYFIIRLFLGLFKPNKDKRILGADVAGRIESKGKNVKKFKIGDGVVADTRRRLGGFAEFIVLKEVDIVKIPKNVSFEQAATVPISGQAAMMGIIRSRIKPGDKILINGASGGVGSFGVQIAKALGAHVTAMSSKEKAETVKSWGADEVIDYKKTLITELADNSFDAVLDTASFESPSKFSKIIKDDGTYVLVGGNFYNMLKVKYFGRFYEKASQEFRTVIQEVSVNDNIKTVLNYIEEGKIDPAIQKVISLKDIPDAINELEQRKVVGKIVVNNQL